jgi:hypothetical protein
MRTNLIRTALLCACLALLIVATTQAEPESARIGDLVLTDNGGIIPRALPKHERVPISAVIDAHIATVDGSHPPAIRSIDVDFDRTILVDAKGLPACRKGKLEARTTAAAKSACPQAIVGEGDGDVEVAFAEQAPFTATGPIVLFNGGVHAGTTVLYVHTYVSVPAPTAVVATVRLTRIHKGPLRHSCGRRNTANCGRGRFGHPVQTQDRPKIHLPRRQGELSHGELPDRALLHRRNGSLRRWHPTGPHPRPAVHAEGLGGRVALCRGATWRRRRAGMTMPGCSE